MEILIQIKKRIVLILILGIFQGGFSQNSEAEIWYQKLDSITINPSLESLQSLESQLQNLKATSPEAKLAKVITYCNLGYYYQKYNELPQAISCYEKAKELFFKNKLSNYDIVEYCLKPLGNLYTQSNAFTEAENTIKDYIILVQKQKNKIQEASGLLNLSIVYKSKGNYDKAIVVLNQALKLDSKNNLIKLQLAENYIKKGDFNEAKNILKQLNSNQLQQPKKLLLEAAIRIHESQFFKAEEIISNAIHILEKTGRTHPRELAKTYYKLAQVQYFQNKLKEAQKNIQQVYKSLIPNFKINQESPDISQLYEENTLIDALDLQAKIFKKQNHAIKALACYQKANHVSSLLLAFTPFWQSKLNFQTNRKNRFEEMLVLVINEFKKNRDSFWFNKAITIDAQSKSFIITQDRKINQILIRNKKDKVVQSYFLVASKIAFINSKLNQEKFNIDSLLNLQNKYSSLLTQQRALFSQLKEKYPEILTSNKTIKVSSIQEKLKKSNSVLVSYFFGTNQIFQFVIEPYKYEINVIANTKTERNAVFENCVTINGFFENASEINNNPIKYYEQTYKLFRALNLPVKQNLIIIPDGILSFIPFDALLTKELTTIKPYEKTPFLVHSLNVSYQLSFYDFILGNEQQIKNAKILAVFPQFKNTAKELSFSLEEAAGIKKNYKTKILKNEEANTNNFLNELPNYPIVHLSTHAHGGTFITSPQIEFIDKKISLDQLYSLQLDTKLVILSACETGVGKLIKGEGVFNLARGFTYAGANNILFSLWNVNDKATALLMNKFYLALSKRNTTSQSLALAKRNYLKDNTISNSKKSPFYWASFVYYGEAIRVIPNNTALYYWVFSILGVLLIVLLIRKLKKLFDKQS